MMSVIGCVLYQHDLRLVAVSVVICLMGSAATMQLFQRILSTSGKSRGGWIALASVGTGTMIWCTHFIAMMGFVTEAPVVLDVPLTLVSLAIAIGLAGGGLCVAASPNSGKALLGGGIIGLGTAAMHYTGMAAYRVDGLVTWHWSHVAASVILSTFLSAAAFRYGRKKRSYHFAGASGLLSLAVASLHFTAMAAMTVRVMGLSSAHGLSASTMAGLGMATACAAVLFIGCAAVSTLIDNQNQTDTHRRLRHMALHDSLTDLPNRMCFRDDLEQRIGKNGGTPFMAVVMLDLSRFKAVNDTYGHQAGDQLLMALAARMTATLREGECVARLGGDEFGALCSYSTDVQLRDFLQRLSAMFHKPFVFERFSASVGANIGVALAPDHGADADTLLARADLAMYRAKRDRIEIPCYYDTEMDEMQRQKRELTNELREAISAHSFELHYQVQASVLDL